METTTTLAATVTVETAQVPDLTPKAILAEMPNRREATKLETVEHEIGFMISHRMKRLLVICDMHGDDLSKILSPVSMKKVDVHDGRSVMREAILSELNQLNREISSRLNDTWPLKA